MPTLRRAELETALELLGIACELEGPEPFPLPFLEELRRVVHAEWTGYVAIDRRRETHLEGAWVGDGVDEPEDPEMERIYWDTLRRYSCPGYDRQDRTGDFSTYRMSDLTPSRREYHRLPIYRDYFSLGAGEYGLEVPLPAKPGEARFLISWRTLDDCDFGASDRDLLEVLRPHLGRMLERAELRRRFGEQLPFESSCVTDREREILDLVALGKTNAEIAAVLWVAPSTVKKHLENVYAKLGVANRAAAVAVGRANGGA